MPRRTPDRPTRPDPPQDNSEVHFKVRHTTKFEKVRAFTPRGARRSVARMASATRKPPHSLSLTLPLTSSSLLLRRSSTRSAPASLSSPAPCASYSTASASTPIRPLKRCASPPRLRSSSDLRPRGKPYSVHRVPTLGPALVCSRVSILSSLNPQLDMEDGDSIDAMMEQVGGR